MKKFSIIVLFILGFFVVFALSAVITFTLTLDRDEAVPEETTEAEYSEVEIPSAESEIEAEVAVTRVTPALTAADTIIVKTVYGNKPEEEAEGSYEMPEISNIEVIEEDEAVKEKAAPVALEKKAEAKKEEVKTEEKSAEVTVETPKTETKEEEVKAEAPKAEEPKTEIKKEEVKAEEPVVEEKKEEVKVEEPVVEVKVEEKPAVVLDPNKQYSDTGI